jgi:excisionase family DNA binding protein
MAASKHHRPLSPEKMPDYGLPEVMTADEVANFLRCNVKTVYEAAQQKNLPARRVGRRLVILRDALLAWLWSNECVLPSRRR